MNTSKGCLPFSFNDLYSLCHRSSPTNKKHERRTQIIHNPISINDASEDELLLLPGLSRLLAKNIIDYREKHDGFKQIDELLKVDGMNSILLENIVTDLILNLSSNHKKELIDLNLALHDELCSITGLTPNLVKRIIQHRERKGFFRSVEDLLQIKGINRNVFAVIHSHVMIESLSSRPSSSIHNNSNNNQRNILRFASWNLQQLTNDKIQNPGVREVICRVILENRFSLIGVQEIENEKSLDLIVQELNNPTIPSIKNWSNRYRGKWEFIISDMNCEIHQDSQRLGFIYDKSAGIELKKASTLPFKKYFNQLPYIAMFRVFKNIELVFVNIHFKKQELFENEDNKKDEAKSLSVLAQAMKNTIDHNDIIIFGDFNSTPIASNFEPLVRCNYSYVIQQNTDIDLKTPEGTACLDNIWLSEPAKTFDKGNSGVIRNNLTSIWIPDGWTWGGLVSNHCPIWMELDLS